MENQIALDTSLFLYSIALGFAAGLFFEVFRFVRLAIRHPDCITVLEDLLFFLPLSGVFLLFTFVFSDGTLRWFSLAGLSMGFFLYFSTLGKVLSFFSDRILRWFRATLQFIYRKTFSPFLRILKKVTIYLFTRGKRAVIIILRIRQKKRMKKQKDLLIQKIKKGSFLK